MSKQRKMLRQVQNIVVSCCRARDVEVLEGSPGSLMGHQHMSGATPTQCQGALTTADTMSKR